MLANVWNYWLAHMLMGIGFAVLNLCVFWKFRKMKYRLFRFGGDSPFSFGRAPHWVGWYGFCLVFEKLTSFWTSMLYTELALSIIEAFGMAIGLFLVDRITMMFEPEEYWMPRPKIITPVIYLTPDGKVIRHREEALPPATAVREINAANTPTPRDEEIDSANEVVASEPERADEPTRTGESWFRRNLRGATEALDEAPTGFFRQIRAAATHSRGMLGAATSAVGTTAASIASKPLEAIREHRANLDAAEATKEHQRADEQKRTSERMKDILKDR